MLSGRSFFPVAAAEVGVVMSMRPKPLPEVPQATARVMAGVFRKGHLVMRLREALGEVWADERFVGAFGVRGAPGISPGQLMVVVVLQFTENLTDRQAADAVRERIPWKYALGLELEDPGFDFTVLSEFRDRLVRGGLEELALQALLDRLVEVGLLKSGGRARTDSTHVLAAIRMMNRLEQVGETVRAGLEALAVAAPQWLVSVLDESWQNRYGARIDDLRLPKTEAARDKLMLQYARDGYYLLEAVYGESAPSWVRELPAVQVLRQTWVQQFYRQIDAGRTTVRVRRKAPEGDGLPPGAVKLISPYDLDARFSIKRDTQWGGTKVHFTETCHQPDEKDIPAPGAPAPAGEPPNLIINVVTTAATVTDAEMTIPIHEDLDRKNLMPERHYVDSGYASATAVVQAWVRWGLKLITPLSQDNSPQAKAAAGYEKTAFTFDYDTQQGTCPQNVTSNSWIPGTREGRDVVKVAWSKTTCRPCPARSACTKADRRQITIATRDEHHVLQQARLQQDTREWKTDYALRSGVEGTIRQATHVTGIRTARYRGLPKTSLEHNIAATAINLLRLDAYWSGRPLDRGRTTHLACLDFTLTA